MLNHVSTVVEVNVAGFNSTLLSNGFSGAKGRNECEVVAQSEVQSQTRSSFPGVLDKSAEHAARPRLLIHIAAVGAVGDVKQKRSQRVAGVGRALGVVGLGSGEAQT